MNVRQTLKKIWFPAVVVCVIALQAIGMGNRPMAGDPGYGFISAERTLRPDTIRYRNQFIGNTAAGKEDTSQIGRAHV